MIVLLVINFVYSGILTAIFIYTVLKFNVKIKNLKSSVVNDILNDLPLDEDQLEYKKEIDKKWQIAMEQQRRNFDKKLQEEYTKAEESINFHKIKYKKSIATKRKLSRKVLPDVQSEDTWRDITEE